MNTAEARAWAAGLFLADGTVGIYENNHTGKTFHRVSFALRMMDQEPVHMFNEIIENPRAIREYTEGRKGTLMYSSEQASCEEVLRIGSWLAPLLVGRKQQKMYIVMKLCEDIRRNKHVKPHTPEIIKYRRQLHEACLRAGAETE